ncbi:AMP-binding protein [Oryctes borbonicus]|uniref:AMP-binding protein n=1 Tax=Oryctes borbonicus TaxID=1629725 RepID=A0A0T6AVC1_9SCAR|nr:AMP-binding protein [Oryctes borbonicus]
MALEMQRRGIKPGDIILTCSYNSMDAILPVYSTLYLNATTVTLDPMISLRDSTHLINAISPKLIFVVPEAIALIEGAIANLKEAPGIVVMGSHNKYATLSEFLKPHPDEENFVPKDVKDIRDVCVINFSSGSTGLPKPVMHSNYSMLNSCELISTVFNFDTILVYSSLYWLSGLVLTTVGILLGTRRMYYSNFTPETFMEVVEKYKLTTAFLAPTYAMQFTVENTNKYNKESLTDFLTGGCTVSDTLVANLWKCFPTTKLRLGYGQTEILGYAAVVTDACDHLFTKNPTTCGFPFLNSMLKIADLETGKALGPMERGEVRFKCDTILRGYMNDHEDPFDDEGFVKSGDIGYYDQDNCLYICDRIKEMFKYQNWQVVPASVEAVIYKHPAVLETVVIGVPHEIDDNHPLALVVLRDGFNICEEELLAFINGKLTNVEKLRGGLRVVKQLPKTPSGKFTRAKIRQMVMERSLEELMA